MRSHVCTRSFQRRECMTRRGKWREAKTYIERERVGLPWLSLGCSKASCKILPFYASPLCSFFRMDQVGSSYSGIASVTFVIRSRPPNTHPLVIGLILGKQEKLGAVGEGRATGWILLQEAGYLGPN